MTEITEKPFNLESLIGQTVMIRPCALFNRKRLYTTQGGIDMIKLKNALQGIPDIRDDSPKGWISMEKHGLVYTAGDGNHRIGLACIEGGKSHFLLMEFGITVIDSDLI